MKEQVKSLSNRARHEAHRSNWPAVRRCAQQILQADQKSAEGHYLLGLSEKMLGRPANAVAGFSNAMHIDGNRYDAGIELAQIHARHRDYQAAKELLEKYEPAMQDDPRYLHLAGSVWTDMDLWENAYRLFVRADELQPDTDAIMEKLASCATLLGEADEARGLYERMLARNPAHHQNHFHLSRLGPADNRTHVDRMKGVLAAGGAPPEDNIFLYYAIAKELEDLEEWDESFEYYKRGGDAVASVSLHKLEDDIALIDRIIDICDADWVARGADTLMTADRGTPIFVTGLPRTGTTLTEHILSSHSRVGNAGESRALEFAVRKSSGIQSHAVMNAEIVETLRDADVTPIAWDYMKSVDYLLQGSDWFINKQPYNYLYAGLIARAFPDAPIIHLKRNPMDACFVVYKQIFSWAFRYSYTLGELATYHVAYDKLMRHWHDVLGDRILTVEYEKLVTDQENVTRNMLASTFTRAVKWQRPRALCK